MASNQQKPASFPDMIKQITTKLQSFGSGPHSDSQKEEIRTLQLLLSKAKQENQKTPMVGAQSTIYQAPVRKVDTLNDAVQDVSQKQILDRARLQDLVKEIDPMAQLEDDVEEVLMQVADDFIDNVVNASCDIARHRRSDTLEVKDVQLYLDRAWNMWVPGFGTEELRQYRKAPTTEAHKQRMALLKKSMKKF